MEISKMKRYFIGTVSFILILINALTIIALTTPIGLLRFVPISTFQRKILEINEWLAEIYLFFNSKIQDLMHNPKYRVYSEEKLQRNESKKCTWSH